MKGRKERDRDRDRDRERHTERGGGRGWGGAAMDCPDVNILWLKGPVSLT